jgi:hypothetical protein
MRSVLISCGQCMRQRFSIVTDGQFSLPAIKVCGAKQRVRLTFFTSNIPNWIWHNNNVILLYVRSMQYNGSKSYGNAILYLWFNVRIQQHRLLFPHWSASLRHSELFYPERINWRNIQILGQQKWQELFAALRFDYEPIFSYPPKITAFVKVNNIYYFFVENRIHFQEWTESIVETIDDQ